MDTQRKLENRFWSKVTPTGFCWLWSGALTSSGYGNFNVGGGKYSSAHRFSYTTLVGAVPEGLDLDHLCRVRHCVNPDHLEPVTRSTNVLRGVSNNFHANAVKTHCKFGHEFTEDNTYTYSYKGYTQRKCKACTQARRQSAKLVKERI